MKKKSILLLLAAEFVLLCLFHICGLAESETALSVVSMPIAMPAVLLGRLASCGAFANGLAVMLAAAICCIPLAFVLKNINKKEQRAEHLALLAASVIASIILPLLANPAKLSSLLPFYTDEMQAVVQYGLCLALWSALLCAAVLRILRLFRNADKQALLQYAQKMLLTLCVLFVACIAVNSTGNLILQIKQAQNGADSAVAILHFISDSFPFAADIAVALAFRDIVLHYESGAVLLTQKAESVSRLCCFSIAVTVTLCVLINISHILLLQYCSDFTVSLNIPLVSLAFTLGALLFCRLITENRRLHEDSDMII